MTIARTQNADWSSDARGMQEDPRERVRRTVEAASGMAIAIEHLPAVPTLGWCLDAAQCLADTFPSALAAVMVGTPDAAGRTRDVEAVGVRFSNSSFLAGDSALSARLTRVCEHLETLGEFPGQAGRGMAGSLRDAGERWRETPLARAFDQFTISDLVVVASELPDSEDGRCVATIVAFLGGVGLQPGTTAGPEELGLLDAAGALLAHRARLAIGPKRTMRGSWISDRERDVLDRLVQGKSVREIAEEFGRSTHTVHDHVKSLHKKLHASSRGELVARALGHQSSRPSFRRPPESTIELARPTMDSTRGLSREIENTHAPTRAGDHSNRPA